MLDWAGDAVSEDHIVSLEILTKTDPKHIEHSPLLLAVG